MLCWCLVTYSFRLLGFARWLLFWEYVTIHCQLHEVGFNSRIFSSELTNIALVYWFLCKCVLGARCGNPWSPPNSNLSCHSHSETGDQVCKVTCNEGYRSSLKTPEIRCRQDLQDVSFDWLPFLDDNVCKSEGCFSSVWIVRTFPRTRVTRYLYLFGNISISQAWLGVQVFRIRKFWW